MERVFSGIQPTGELHLGNYLGAVINWVRIQKEYECIYCVVDYHAITIPYETNLMSGRVFDLCCGLLACGIDPERSHLFIQSEVPQHTELAWVFNSVTPMGELSRQTQYKAKAEQHADNLNVGLFTYPVLQAADILLYKATKVPVGEDQAQHLELSREITRRFNARFSPIFPEPHTLLTPTPRIRGLDGEAKMSKSLGNTVGINEEPVKVRAKISRAFTDPERKKRSDPGRPEICNVFALHGFFSSEADQKQLAQGCRSASLGCVDCKKMLAENIVSYFAPIRQRWSQLRSQPDEVRGILDRGRDYCITIAETTMNEVRQALGLR